MKLHRIIVAAALLLLSPGAVRSQHCAPLYQSYLSEVSVKWVEDNLEIHAQYAKGGGAGAKDAYQIHLVAYLDRDEDRVPAPAPGEVLDPEAAVVLHTQVAKRNEKADVPGPWTYDLDFTIRAEDLVDKVIAQTGLGEKDREESKYWYTYRDRIRLAVFVPFLADEKYATLDGLPEDRHECNYQHDRALLFQTLPYRMQFLVSHSPETNGRVWLRVNSDKPAK